MEPHQHGSTGVVGARSPDVDTEAVLVVAVDERHAVDLGELEVGQEGG
jgi:hypothetical protein